MDQLLKQYRLGSGVACGEAGLYAGTVPLLKGPSREGAWEPRPQADLDRDLSAAYGLPIDSGGKLAGIATVAKALNAHDVPRAQIAALHLRLPDPPELTKGGIPAEIDMALLAQLRQSGLLKAGWNPDLHPRWPAGSPDGAGGQFAPSGGVGSAGSTVTGNEAARTASASPSARLIQTQLEEPFEEPFPLVRPAPRLAPSGAVPGRPFSADRRSYSDEPVSGSAGMRRGVGARRGLLSETRREGASRKGPLQGAR